MRGRAALQGVQVPPAERLAKQTWAVDLAVEVAGHKRMARMSAAIIACHDEGSVTDTWPHVRAVFDDAGRRIQRPGDDGLLIEPDGAARRIIARRDEIPGRRAQRPARAQAGHAPLAVAEP